MNGASELLKSFNVIHMTGRNKSGGEKQHGYCPIEFENNMARLYATCNVMVTRAKDEDDIRAILELLGEIR